MARSRALAELSDTELLGMLDEAKDEVMNLRFQNVTGQLNNVAVLAASRKQVARLMTELRNREIHAAETAEATKAEATKVEATKVEAAVATATDTTEPDEPLARLKRRRRRDV